MSIMQTLTKLLRTVIGWLITLVIWITVIIALPGYLYMHWLLGDVYLDDDIKEIFTQPIKATRHLWKN